MRSLFRSLRPRSNGVRVSREVAQLIRAGNAARDLGEWRQAVSAYGRALEKAPHLAHIWVQIGHCHKELGEIEAAQSDYSRAATLAPDDPDPRVHLGMSSKLLGEPDVAHGHYLAALERQPSDLAITIEALRTAPAKPSERGHSISRIAAILGVALPEADAQSGSMPHVLCADVTDLLTYFGRSRLPTGIQRVQIEVVVAISVAKPELVTICCYSAQRRGWSAVDAERFLTLARMALESDDREDPEWRREVAAFHVLLARAPLLNFGPGTVLVNLGTSWSERNYLLHVRAAREESGIAYIPMIYDCIPMFAPQWFPSALTRDYRSWMAGLLDAADGMIAISQATRSDLLRTMSTDSAPVSPDAIHVVPMDGDFRRAGQASRDVGRLSDWGLAPGSYVLMVSTIEPRKNHVGAFQAWCELIGRHGEGQTPTLVCVGGRGWLNEPVHAMLRRQRVLRAKVMLLSGIADADLDLLYRCALFTLYPSFYEGWGLPVTESLCHGRVPAISNSSSLPEAGRSFAVYFDPHDPIAIADAITPLIFDEGRRCEREEGIRRDFKPRPWQDIAASIVSKASDLASKRFLSRNVPHAKPDIYYALGTEVSGDDLSRSGERFRAGWNWAEPSAEGNPIGPGIAVLKMMLPLGRWMAHIRMTGGDGMLFRLRSSETEMRQYAYQSGASSWWTISVAPDVSGLAEIHIEGDDRLSVLGFALTRPGDQPPSFSGSAPA